MSKKKTLWAFDCETPKFSYGVNPKPFLWCAVSENGERVIYWGEDATEKFMAWILTLENALLIGHNSGKFDSLFLKPIIKGVIILVDGRIIKWTPKKGVEVRDSFAILPMALKKLGAKIEIDLNKHADGVRENHKQEIIRYCLNDCIVLLDAVIAFYEKAGKRRLTIASQASAELRSIYPHLPKLNEEHHAEFSPFFFGGRVECFQKGIIKNDLKLFDVNSMYPYVMSAYQHPYSDSYSIIDYSPSKIPEHKSGFFYGTVDSDGAFPVRLKNKTTPYLQALNVDIKITMHELIAAIDCGVVSNIRGKMIIPKCTTDFKAFIYPHFESRKKAKAIGDMAGDIYHKLIPNSSYGRFAMSPEGRDEIYYAEHGEKLEFFTSEINGLKMVRLENGNVYTIKDIDLEAERYILSRPTPRPWTFYEDVATGASITGAARAELLRAKCSAVMPVYCDTDSLLCQELNRPQGNNLGEWKLECSCDTAAIAGKKMYVLLNKKRPVKQASKGVKASPDEIYMAADGEEIEIYNEAPTMRLHKTSFVKRVIRRT